MFDLVTLENIKNVLIGESQEERKKEFILGASKRAINFYKRRPGFFEPYANSKEFAGGLLAPVVYPLEMTAVASITTLFAVLSSIVCVGNLLVAVKELAVGDALALDGVLKEARDSLLVTGYALVVATTCLLVAAISIPHSLVSLVSRSIASSDNARMQYSASSTLT